MLTNKPQSDYAMDMLHREKNRSRTGHRVAAIRNFSLIGASLIVMGIALAIAGNGVSGNSSGSTWRSLFLLPLNQSASPKTSTPTVKKKDAATSPSSSPTTTTTTTAESSPSVTILAAGDISTCSNDNDEATAKLLDALTGTILTLGDNAYNTGTSSEFSNCFDPTWGRHKSRILPVAGNHEYLTGGATGYFGYFGSTAGDSDKGYYSFNLGAWHLIALNSNCSIVSCSAGSPQETWLKSDLAANKTCSLAYFHHPRFSSGSSHGDNVAVSPLWDVLYENGVEVVLNGHEHNYERFAPQKPDATADPTKGIREFVVGTGGYSLYNFGVAKANSEIRDNSGYGIVKLTLSSDSYSWQFVPAAGYSFTDSGTSSCH